MFLLRHVSQNCPPTAAHCGEWAMLVMQFRQLPQ
jgi:hypothetical protein